MERSGDCVFGGDMVNKILLWARSTEIWIVMAQIYTVLLCLFMMKCHLYGAHRVDKYIGALAFALILALSFRYSLYKLNVWWIYFVFFIVAYAGGISEKLSVTKVFGTPTMRNWYFYLLPMIVAYVLTGSKRDRWFIAMAENYSLRIINNWQKLLALCFLAFLCKQIFFARGQIYLSISFYRYSIILAIVYFLFGYKRKNKSIVKF